MDFVRVLLQCRTRKNSTVQDKDRGRQIARDLRARRKKKDCAAQTAAAAYSVVRMPTADPSAMAKGPGVPEDMKLCAAPRACRGRLTSKAGSPFVGQCWM